VECTGNYQAVVTFDDQVDTDTCDDSPTLLLEETPPAVHHDGLCHRDGRE
jgi:hypothetical protein